MSKNKFIDENDNFEDIEKPIKQKTRTRTRKKTPKSEFETINFENSGFPGDLELPEELIKDLEKNIAEIFNSEGGPKDKGNVRVVCAQPNRHNPEKIKKMQEEEQAKLELEYDQIFRLNRMIPKDIVAYLDKYVISQYNAKRALAVAICDHYNRIRRILNNEIESNKEYTKHNVLFLGPTGVGKTYLIRRIAKNLGIPFIKADATKFSETGYMGYDVEDIIRDLVRASNNKVDLAKYGIVYIDEIDKIASKQTHNKDVSGRGVQINLLKLMEECEVRLIAQNDMVGQMQMAMQVEEGKNPPRTINTRHILFIVSGAFDKLSNIISQRLGGQTIGFHSESLKQDSQTLQEDLLQLVETSDLVKFGFEPEFVGRLPIRVALSSLTSDDLKKILLSTDENLLQQYQDSFEDYGIKLEFADDAIEQIAEQAKKENTGARGLTTILERSLRNFKYELAGSKIDKLIVTRDLILDPDAYLTKIIS